MENLIGDCVQGKQSQLILSQCQQEACACLKQLNGSGATRRSGLAAAEVRSHRQLESDPCPLAIYLPLQSGFQVRDKVTERHEIKRDGQSWFGQSKLFDEWATMSSER